MALTFATVSTGGYRVQDVRLGNYRRIHRKVTFDNSYPTGGEPLAPGDVGMKRFYEVNVHGAARKTDATDALHVSYDYTNSKLVAYRQKDPAAAGGADIALPEVGNTADLSAYSVHVSFLGV